MSIAGLKKEMNLQNIYKLSLALLNSTEIEVFDITTTTNTSTKYHAIRAAARALNLDKRYVEQVEQYIYLNLKSRQTCIRY